MSDVDPTEPHSTARATPEQLAERREKRAERAKARGASEAVVRRAATLAEPQDAQEIGDLRPWQRVAIAMMELYGMTQREVVDQMRGGKGQSTLSKARSSPGGQDWIAQIHEIAADPHVVVANIMRFDAVEALADHMLARTWAREARDYKALHSMTKDVPLRPILERETASARPQAIVINLGAGGSLETAEHDTVEVDYEILDEAGMGSSGDTK